MSIEKRLQQIEQHIAFASGESHILVKHEHEHPGMLWVTRSTTYPAGSHITPAQADDLPGEVLIIEVIRPGGDHEPISAA